MTRRIEGNPVIQVPHRRCKDVLMLRVDARTLDRIDLSEAYLAGALLRGQRCRRVILRAATLREADVSDADLRGADLVDANFQSADLRGTDLRGTRLEGADFTGALYDGRTRWPRGFDPEAAHAVFCSQHQDGGRTAARFLSLVRARRSF